jgi:hypothetical protein
MQNRYIIVTMQRQIAAELGATVPKGMGARS